MTRTNISVGANVPNMGLVVSTPTWEGDTQVIDNTGTIDVTTELTTFLGQLSSGGGGKLWLPPGKYLFSGLALPDDSWIEGLGARPTANVAYGDGTVAVELAYNPLATSSGLSYIGSHGITLRNFALIGQPSVNHHALSWSALGSFGTDRPWFQNLYVYNWGANGFNYGANRGGGRMDDIIFSTCGQANNGFPQCAIISGTDLDWFHCSFTGAYSNGINIEAEMNRFFGCDVYGNGSVGALIQSSQVFFYGASFDQNQHQGVYASGAITGVYIGARFSTNGLAANATYAHCDVSAVTGDGVITLGPDTVFDSAQISGSNKPNYDINVGSTANAVNLRDFSSYLGSLATVGHCNQAGAATTYYSYTG